MLAAQAEDAVVKMRVDLGPEDYKVAGRARLEDRYVSVRGVLRRRARVHRLEAAMVDL